MIEVSSLQMKSLGVNRVLDTPPAPANFISSLLLSSFLSLTLLHCSLLYCFVLSFYCLSRNYALRLLIKGAQKLSLDSTQTHNTSHSFNISFVDTWLTTPAVPPA